VENKEPAWGHCPSLPQARDVCEVAGWVQPKAPARRGWREFAQPGSGVSPALPGLGFDSLGDDKKVLVRHDLNLDIDIN